MTLTTIGFSNLSEQHSFAVIVREGLEAAAAQYPDVNLIVRDNDMDNERALAIAQEFAAYPVDAAIIYHIDERIGPNVRAILYRQRVTSIISVDIPIPMTIFLGINNRQAGLLVGEALGKWIQTHWDGQVDRVLVVTEQRVLGAVQQRLDFGLHALANYVNFDPKMVLRLDGGNHREHSAANVHSVLERWDAYHRIAAICLNDDSALGVLDAARALGREADVAVTGQNANLAIEEFRANPDTRLVASANYFPEQYGERLLDLALRMLAREKVPPENFIEPALVTPEQY